MNNREAIIPLCCPGVNTITIIKNSKLVSNKFSKILVERVWPPFSLDLNPMHFSIWSIWRRKPVHPPFKSRSIKTFTRKRMGKNPAEYYTCRG